MCENPLVDKGTQDYLESKIIKGPDPDKGPVAPPRPKHTASKLKVEEDISPEKQWKWSGTDFVKSPTVEPWVNVLIYCVRSARQASKMSTL